MLNCVVFFKDKEHRIFCDTVPNNHTLVDFECIIRYKIGKTTNVRMVDEMIPPITTVASGLCTSAPVPTFSAMGMKPKLATSAVIKTGRNLVIAPSTIELIKSPVSSTRCLINDNITKPFSTAIPESAINPTPADIDSGMSRIQSAKTPPVKAKGTPVKMIKASRNEPNTTTSNTSIRKSVAGTTIDSR